MQTTLSSAARVAFVLLPSIFGLFRVGSDLSVGPSPRSQSSSSAVIAVGVDEVGAHLYRCAPPTPLTTHSSNHPLLYSRTPLLTKPHASPAPSNPSLFNLCTPYPHRAITRLSRCSTTMRATFPRRSSHRSRLLGACPIPMVPRSILVWNLQGRSAGRQPRCWRRCGVSFLARDRTEWTGSDTSAGASPYQQRKRTRRAAAYRARPWVVGHRTALSIRDASMYIRE